MGRNHATRVAGGACRANGGAALGNAIEGVFARNSTPPSLLSALFWIRCGDPLTPFLAADDRGPERRFDGGAQQLSLRMADALGKRVICGAAVSHVSQSQGGIRATGMDFSVAARRAIVTIPPALAGVSPGFGEAGPDASCAMSSIARLQALTKY